MRIGIYTLFLTPGQIGGIETYLCHLVRALGQVDQVNEYILFVGEHNQSLFQDITYPHFKQVKLSSIPGYESLPVRALQRLKLIRSRLSKEINAYPVEVLHYPGTTIDQLDLEIPCVLTMHDLQHEYFPQFFSHRELVRRRAAYKPSAQKARHIITDTEFTKNGLVEKYGISPQKITAIHFGVNQNFNTSVDPALIAQVKSRYYLPEQFLFFPANFWPHKNHGRLFEALKIVRQKYQHQKCQLVLSGIFPKEQGRLRTLIIEQGLQEAIHILGYIPYTDLPGIYAAAELLVFPSLFEGFGIPLLEAMACGCPIVSANTTSLPEVAGDAAVFVNPYDVEAIAETIHTVLKDEALRASLKVRGLERVKHFSWQEAARKTVEVYQSVF